MILASAPLDPGPDEARGLLARELAHPEYHQEGLAQQVFDWLTEQWAKLLAATSSAGIASTLAALVIALTLGSLLVWLLTRARGEARLARGAPPLLPDERVSAPEHRRRAEAALAAGDHAEVVVEGFRAIAVRQIELGVLEDHPEATARETAASLAGAFPDRSADLADLVVLFDDVLYGERPATREQAQRVLDLDLDLVGGR